MVGDSGRSNNYYFPFCVFLSSLKVLFLFSHTHASAHPAKPNSYATLTWILLRLSWLFLLSIPTVFCLHLSGLIGPWTCVPNMHVNMGGVPRSGFSVSGLWGLPPTLNLSLWWGGGMDGASEWVAVLLAIWCLAFWRQWSWRLHNGAWGWGGEEESRESEGKFSSWKPAQRSFLGNDSSTTYASRQSIWAWGHQTLSWSCLLNTEAREMKPPLWCWGSEEGTKSQE